MRRGAIKALVAAAALAAIGCGLAACMQVQTRQPVAALPPQTTPSFGLFYVDEGGSAKLAYGQANSDNVDLMLQCAKGSRVVVVIGALQSKGAPVLTLASNGKVQTLKTKTEDGEGGALQVARSAYDTAPLTAFRRSGQLEVTHGPSRVGVIATAEERVGVERFFAACGG